MWRALQREDRLARIERLFCDIYVAAEGATLRDEDRCKARQLDAMLVEIEAAAARLSARSPLVLLDAAAGKSYVALLASKLVLEPAGRSGAICTIERDERRVQASRLAEARLASRLPIECRCGDVSDSSIWPREPSLVVALHACGTAADAIIESAIASGARSLLLVPCCTARSLPSAVRAERAARVIGVPKHGAVRGRFVQSWVDSLRTLRLEAAGYETEVVEFVPPTLTPHNLLWRARRVREPGRMERARRAMERMCSVTP
jgi:hypothetical protein